MTSAVLRVAAFPLLVFAVPMGGLVLLRSGAAPTVATLLPLVVGVVLVALLERVIPYEPSWNRSRGDVGLDSIHLAVTLVASSLTQGAVAGAASVTTARGGFDLWPSAWPVVSQVGLALLVSDLGVYLVHRASHESEGLLWRIHSVHHSAERLYWLNGGRFHPANVVYNVALKAAPLAFLGAGQETIVAAGLVSALSSFVTHANLDLRAGPLNRLFSTPEVHRWHHARDLRHANANYGGTLVVWDVLFGTWSLPSRRLPSDAVGLEDSEGYPTTMAGQLCHPLAKQGRLVDPCFWSRVGCCAVNR
jgi:sterol desaturase/sphingolipid hydroxylase (fatty acid hydroxylase superfamily)